MFPHGGLAYTSQWAGYYKKNSTICQELGVGVKIV
jgi:hypothetical protein